MEFTYESASRCAFLAGFRAGQASQEAWQRGGEAEEAEKAWEGRRLSAQERADLAELLELLHV